MLSINFARPVPIAAEDLPATTKTWFHRLHFTSGNEERKKNYGLILHDLLFDIKLILKVRTVDKTMYFLLCCLFSMIYLPLTTRTFLTYEIRNILLYGGMIVKIHSAI